MPYWGTAIPGGAAQSAAGYAVWGGGGVAGKNRRGGTPPEGGPPASGGVKRGVTRKKYLTISNSYAVIIERNRLVGLLVD